MASGYYDMEGERQHLNDIVLPQLRQQCILYRTQVLHRRILLLANDLAHLRICCLRFILWIYEWA